MPDPATHRRSAVLSGPSDGPGEEHGVPLWDGPSDHFPPPAWSSYAGGHAGTGMALRRRGGVLRERVLPRPPRDPRMGCAAPVPLPEFNVNPLFSEGFGGQNYRWLTMDRCGHCRRSWSELESPSVGSHDVPDVG